MRLHRVVQFLIVIFIILLLALASIRRQTRRINVLLLYIGGEKSIWSIWREDFLNFLDDG